MAYCTTSELVNITGSTRSSTILTDIIAESDRKINTYLKRYKVTGVAGDELKSASLTLSKAGLLEYGLQVGDFQGSSGDSSSSLNVTEAVKALRAEANEILDQYVTANTTTDGARTRCSRIRSRCS